MELTNLKPAFVSVAALSLIAIFHLPYGFYIFLRISVCACSIATAYLTFNDPKFKFIAWISIAIAILFNPIIPIHLNKEIWSFFNVAVAAFYSFLTMKLSKAKE